MVKAPTWPHGVLYTPGAPPIVCKNISSMALLDGYITVMGKEPLRIRSIMLTHLQERMEDGERYGWPAVRAIMPLGCNTWSRAGQLGEMRKQR